MAEGVRTAGLGVNDASRVAAGPRPPASAGEAAAPGQAGEAAAGVCPECGERLAGVYCHGCGEKRPDARDLSVRHFFGEAAQELTSVEHSKLYHTLRALLFRPGLLTNEWVAGRRRRYLKPLNLCIAIFAISVFAFSAYKHVSMYDMDNVINQDRTGNTRKVFERLAAKKKMEPGAMLDRISEKWQRFMSVSSLFFIVGFAVVLQLFFLFSRRYFVEHLVFAMHFVSFSLLTTLALWPLYFFIGIKPGGVNTFVGVGKSVVDAVYMFFAVRAVYGTGTGRTLLAALLLTVGYFVTYIFVFLCAFVLALLAVAFS